MNYTDRLELLKMAMQNANWNYGRACDMRRYNEERKTVDSANDEYFSLLKDFPEHADDIKKTWNAGAPVSWRK